MNYFSFCLFDRACYTPKPFKLNFWDYFKGFKENCKIIKKHFPDWKILLFLDTALKQTKYDEMFIFFEKNPFISVIWQENDIFYERSEKHFDQLFVHPTGAYNYKYFNSFTLKRYYALDMPFNALVIRDADQQISLVDIQHIKKWLDDDSSQYLIYFLHTTHSIDGICGGGFATKTNKLGKYFRNENYHVKYLSNSYINDKDSTNEATGFSFDEYFVWSILLDAKIICKNENDKLCSVSDKKNISYLLLEQNLYDSKKYVIAGTSTEVINCNRQRSLQPFTFIVFVVILLLLLINSYLDYLNNNFTAFSRFCPDVMRV